ncbi:MAG: A24 family peptidase [Sedimenticola sp.]
MTDFDHLQLPDSIVLPGLWGGFFLRLFAIFNDTQSAIIGAVAGYLPLWTVFQLLKLLTGKEKRGFALQVETAIADHPPPTDPDVTNSVIRFLGNQRGNTPPMHNFTTLQTLRHCG